MVTISSRYLPENVAALSRADIQNICSALITLEHSLSVKPGGVVLKPFLSIEFYTPTHFARVTFKCDVNIDEIMSCIPHDVEYQPFNFPKKDGQD